MNRISKLIAGVAAILAALAAAVASSSPATAGGWVVVSFDDAPAVHAGAPTEVGFTVLRHGVTPESSDDMQVVVTARDGTQERFDVTAEGDVGHHVVTVTLDAGAYTWALHGTFMPYDLGVLDVGGSPSASWAWDAAQWGGFGAAIALGGLAGSAALRRRGRRAAAPAAA